MSTLRYSGEIRIRVTYLDHAKPLRPNGRYRCFLRGPGGMRTTIIVGAPAFLSHGVDSPEAFDDAARSALAFADHEDCDTPSCDGSRCDTWSRHTAWNADGSDRHVGRTLANAWPKVAPRSGGDFVNDRSE
jgi:hypothetical protein